MKRQAKGTAGADLLFEVRTEREEQNAVAVASNQSFGGWTRTVTDHAAAPPSSTD